MRSRKFWSAWALTILASGLLLQGSLESSGWAGAMSMIWMAYFAANHADKRVEDK